MLKESHSWREFKMKLDISGIDMYNINVLRHIRYRVPCSMKCDFDSDVAAHIDTPQLMDLALATISNYMKDNTKPLAPFDVYIAQQWIGKHENEYRTRNIDK